MEYNVTLTSDEEVFNLTFSTTAYTVEFATPGPQGPTGYAATIEIGTVTTGAAGSSASVSNSGDEHDAVFNFTIPRGNTGATGATGAAATIAVGTVSSVPTGSPATVTNVGTSGAAVFDFQIPVGLTGATGATGAAATITVGTVTTGAPGAPATVTNVGTSGAAVFNFTIPQGDPGDDTTIVNSSTRASPQSVSTAISIPSVVRGRVFIKGSAGPVVDPTIANGSATHELFLFGCSDTDTVELNDQSNIQLSGKWIAINGSIMCLHWDGASKWVEAYRNEI